jgi:hypothetical protein
MILLLLGMALQIMVRGLNSAYKIAVPEPSVNENRGIKTGAQNLISTPFLRLPDSTHVLPAPEPSMRWPGE